MGMTQNDPSPFKWTVESWSNAVQHGDIDAKNDQPFVVPKWTPFFGPKPKARREIRSRALQQRSQ